MTNVTVEYLGITAQGSTLTKAKAKAAAMAERLVKDCDPLIWCYHGYTIVCSSSPYGAGYTIIRPDAQPGRQWGSSSGEGSKEEALIAARRHLAQMLFTESVIDPSDKQGLADFKYWRQWQNFITEGKLSHGLTDSEELRAYADEQQRIARQKGIVD